MQELLKKFKSRKFWLSAIVIIANIVMLFIPQFSNTIIQAANCLSILVMAIFYIVVEGKIDEKSISLSVDFMKKLLSTLAEAGLNVPDISSVKAIKVNEETGEVIETEE